MLKYKNIKELTNEDDNKLNNIILKNYYKEDDSKNYSNNGWICVDIKYVFELINDTGKNILKLIDNSALNYLEYINSNIKIQKKLNKFYNDWISEMDTHIIIIQVQKYFIYKIKTKYMTITDLLLIVVY